MRVVPYLGPRNRDRYPRIEFLAPLSHTGAGPGKLDPLVGFRWVEVMREILKAKAFSERPMFLPW